MSPLEERYRRLLRALPEPARSRWADEMTDTYLDATCADDPEYAEYGSPSPADRLDVWRLALRLRLGAPGASARAVLTGAVVRRVALLGALLAAAPAVLGLVGRALTPDLPWVGGWPALLATGASVCSVALLGCLVHGSRATRPLAAVLLVAQLVASARAVDAVPWSAAAVGAVALAAAVPLVAALLVAPAPEARPGRWWAGAAGALALVTGLPWATSALPVWWSTPAVGAAALAVVGIGACLRGAAALAGGSAVLAVASLPAVLLPAFAGGPGPYVAGQATAGALLVLCAVPVR